MPTAYTARLMANKPRTKTRFDYGRLNKIESSLGRIAELTPNRSTYQPPTSPRQTSRVGSAFAGPTRGAQTVSNLRNRFDSANNFGRNLTDLKRQAVRRRQEMMQPRQQQIPAMGGAEFTGGNPSVRGVSAEQMGNARTIYNVGRRLGASNRDIQIALMTAFQESGLRNLNYGDRDSLGLFQQRPSQGWGSRQQVTNPEYAAGKFFNSLLRLGGRDKMALTQAAQAVQRSAFPNAYAKWEGQASAILNSFINAGASPKTVAAVAGGLSKARQTIVNTALAYQGTPYAWGGGGTGRRTSRGTGLGTQNVIGVDCSGLTQYAYSMAGIKIPRHSNTQLRTMGYKTAIKNLRPGDLVGWARGGHVAVYIGNGQIMEARKPGTRAAVRRLGNNEGAFGVHISLPGD